MKLELKYQNGQPMLTNITRISKPGRRLYSSYKKLPKPLGGYGLVILTTNRGLMIDKGARQEKNWRRTAFVGLVNILCQE